MIYLFLADGFEEIEALTTLDLLRRVGIEVTTVAVGKKVITGAHNIKIVPDIPEKKVLLNDKIKGIILPGGMPGTLNLNRSKKVEEAMEFCANKGRLIAAICAAPMIPGKKGLLNNRNAICFPGYEKDLEGAVIVPQSVCRDENFITAKGAGVSVQFAHKIIEYFKGTECADKLLEDIQWLK